MTTITISDVRKNFSDTLNVVQYQHERVILQRHGKTVAVIVPVEDYETLEELEDKYDVKQAEKVLLNSTKDDFVSLEDVRKELGL